MCDGQLAEYPKALVSTLPSDRGPEGNLKMWEEAEEYLDLLCRRTEYGSAEGSEGTHMVLIDADNRCTEERRRAEVLMRLCERRTNRRIGGVGEPESPVRK